MKYVFGPVPSRRLGRSLGVDPVPLKTCNFNCVYCQLGRTSLLQRKRRAFFNVTDMVAEIASALDRQGADSIDWITFVGSGETTLFSRLGSLIRYVKSLSKLPVAVITNGSLLDLPEVRNELCAADAVLPSLDAGSEGLFKKINRPHRDLSFDRHVAGLIEFRREFKGHLWVEVMLLGGVNDSPSDLRDISKILERVGPEEIHISMPTRPPAEPWVELPSPESRERAASILGGVAKVLQPVEVECGVMHRRRTRGCRRIDRSPPPHAGERIGQQSGAMGSGEGDGDPRDSRRPRQDRGYRKVWESILVCGGRLVSRSGTGRRPATKAARHSFHPGAAGLRAVSI